MKDSDLRIEACSDALIKGEKKRGGQSVGVIPMGVLVTHVPTGIMAYAANQRSQFRNLATAKAMIQAGLQDLRIPI